MKHASLIAFISVALMSLMQLYNLIYNIIEYGEYMDIFGYVFPILYFCAYCGVGYFFLRLFIHQKK